jgi:CubicO group peptidase (beta-lactamase class C family)
VVHLGALRLRPKTAVRQLLNHTSGVPDYFDESVMGVIGKVVKTSIEEANMSGDKVNIDSLEAIAFDPYTHGYYKVSGRVGEAFSDGKKLF